MMRVTKLLMALILLLIAIADCSGAAENNDDPLPDSIGKDVQIDATARREIHSSARSSDLVYEVTTTEDLVHANALPLPSQKLPAELQQAIPVELTGETFELIWIEAFDEAPIGPIDPQSRGADI
jgi:hypothetical protein